MKQGHLILIFLTIYIGCILLLSMEQKKYDYALEEKQRVENALINAMSNAGRKYKSAIMASEEKRKGALEQAFFESWYVSMGVFDDKVEKENLHMYLPMLILAEEEGAYFYYMQESRNAEGTELQHIWSEKVLYKFSEEDTDAEKKNKVATALERYASDVITNHNHIASQYGLSYSFYVPKFLQNSATSLEFPMIFVVFQGWPLTVYGDIVYNNCLDAGMYLQEKEKYVVTKIKNVLNDSFKYHVESCAEIGTKENVIVKESITEKEAIFKFGAYPCEKCIPQKENFLRKTESLQ